MPSPTEQHSRLLSIPPILLMASCLALLWGSPAQALTTPADRAGDHVLQGDHEAGGTSPTFQQNNGNARRVGTGGAGSATRVNQPIFAFTLPTIPAGLPITNVTFTVRMDDPLNPAPSSGSAISGGPLDWDMVICLMTQTNISGITTNDYLPGTTNVNSMLGNGIVLGQIDDASVSNGAVVSVSMTGAALTQFESLYDAGGNPLQSEVFFRLSNSEEIDTSLAANNSKRFNLWRDNDDASLRVERTLEITTVADGPAEIIVQPQDTEVVLGAAEAQFSVAADGRQPISYQWRLDGTPIAGATNETLIILNPDADDLGGYTVVASNELGSATSTPAATLSYISGPITPGDGAAVEGGVVTYSVELPQAATNYTYQWNQDGIAITPAETNATLELSPVELADAGTYTVDVTFDGVTATSDPVILLVGSAANDYPTTVLADNPIAWWRLGELTGTNALDSAGSAGGPYDGIYLPQVQLDQAGAILGDSDRAARFIDTADSKVTVDYDPDLNPAGAFSVEAWVLIEGGENTKRAVITSMEDVSGTEKYGYELAANAANQWRFSTGRFAPGETIITGPPVVPLEWTHLVAVYDGSSNELYVNGYPVGSVPVLAFDNVSPAFPVPLFIGASGSEDGLAGPGDSFFDGLIDEVAFYNTALSGADVLEHYAAGLPADAPPTFSLEPTDKLSDIGGQVTFNAAVVSVGPPTFQWQKDGVDIPGATLTSLALTNLTLMDAGDYRILADVAGNTVTSAVATLTIRPPSTVLLENFETYAAGLFGPVASTNDWVLDSTVQTNLWTVDVEGTNQYLRLLSDVNGTSRIGALNMGDSSLLATATNGVPTEGISTVFMRFYYESGVDNGLWWGTIDGPGTGFGAFRGSVSSRQTTPPGLSVRAPSGAVVLSTNLAYDTWYNMWQVHDNAADTMEVYLTTGNSHATTNDRFEVNGEFAFGFRMDSAGDVSVNPLNYYQFITRSEAAGFRVDDIYISTGTSLVNPVALPELDPLGISLQSGSPEITWTDSGTLQSTDDLEGDVWTDLPAATSPYTPPAGPANESFRLRGN